MDLRTENIAGWSFNLKLEIAMGIILDINNRSTSRLRIPPEEHTGG